METIKYLDNWISAWFGYISIIIRRSCAVMYLTGSVCPTTARRHSFPHYYNPYSCLFNTEHDAVAITGMCVIDKHWGCGWHAGHKVR